jgi:hypothetical protein
MVFIAVRVVGSQFAVTDASTVKYALQMLPNDGVNVYEPSPEIASEEITFAPAIPLFVELIAELAAISFNVDAEVVPDTVTVKVKISVELRQLGLRIVEQPVPVPFPTQCAGEPPSLVVEILL